MPRTCRKAGDTGGGSRISLSAKPIATNDFKPLAMMSSAWANSRRSRVVRDARYSWTERVWFAGMGLRLARVAMACQSRPVLAAPLWTAPTTVPLLRHLLRALPLSARENGTWHLSATVHSSGLMASEECAAHGAGLPEAGAAELSAFQWPARRLPASRTARRRRRNGRPDRRQGQVSKQRAGERLLNRSGLRGMPRGPPWPSGAREAGAAPEPRI